MSTASYGLTLTHWILAEQQQHADATGDLSICLQAMESASKFVSSKIRAAGLFDLYGAHGSENASGDTQKKLDIVANDAFKRALERSGKVSMIATEEDEEAIVFNAQGKYTAVFDPLDGSSNIDANVSIGTIFGVYERADRHATPSVAADILQPGTRLVAAGYTMYGSATMIVLTIRNAGVHGFTLDPAAGEFVLTHPSIKTRPSRTIYSVNEGNSKFWSPPTRAFVDACKNPADAAAKPYSLRYVGSMVADVHRTLLYGGIFMYPGDSNSPHGKLRLLYEANPMAMVMEAAGGKATAGTQRILDIVPTSIHQRTPVYIGSPAEVDKVVACFEKHEAATAAAAAEKK